MILKELVIDNFGLYKGRFSFNLHPLESTSKNVTLIVGQNGVGKTTISEALQLCLSGPFILGDRTAVAEYEKYLIKRVHRDPRRKNSEINASIEVSFDYVKAGSIHQFRIIRSWNNVPDNFAEKLSVFEDGRELEELNDREKNLYLKELVPPGYLKVIFFDGERLRNLNDNSELNSFISDCCQTLFGLNLVNLLQKDIEHYSSKLITEKSDDSNYVEYSDLNKEIKTILKQKEELVEKESSLIKKIESLKAKTILIEDQIAKKGRWVAEKVNALEAKRHSLEHEIGVNKKELIEIYNDLGPFAASTALCVKLQKRLKRESKVEKWKSAEEILKERIEEMTTEFSDSPVWEKLKIETSPGSRKKIAEEFKKILIESSADFSDKKIIHDLSEGERNKMISDIDTIVHKLPERIHILTDTINKNEASLLKLSKERSSFSSQEEIKILMDELQSVNKMIGAAENEKKNNRKKIDESDKRSTYFISRRDASLRKVQIKDEIDRKLHLTQQVSLILDKYSSKITDKKLSRLEEVLGEKFNLLCRKKDYFDSVYIDRITFNVTLQKGHQEISQEHLSAGERQLLALSLLWALHSISNIDLPLIIDTPLARLDKKHRESILKVFIPSVSKQVVVLGTEIELDSAAFDQLSTNTGQFYELQYDVKNHSTKVFEREDINHELIESWK